MKKQTENIEYDALRKALKEGELKPLYAFYGEERYLLEYYLAQLRMRIPRGTEEFNHKRFDGKNFSIDELEEAVNAIPVFSDIILIEVSDFNFSKTGDEDRRRLIDIFEDIPEYICIVFVFDTVEFKLDGRVKENVRLKKLLAAVEFRAQGEAELSKWIAKHFKAAGKAISFQNAEYLTFITGGLMTNLSTEIEKLVSCSENDEITRADIDAVVTPVLDAAVYELTDGLVNDDYELAIKKLGELFAMNEAPHRILFSITLKMRQLLYARILVEAGGGIEEFMKLAGIRYSFQAKALFSAARRTTLARCGNMVRFCADTAYRLNRSQADGQELCAMLVAQLALESRDG